MSKAVQIVSLFVGAALLGGVAMPVWAVDGVILIDQNKAMTGNVTPGDTPGFPVTISLPGSYRLAVNLTVPDENTTAIEINVDHVTLDLNGFAILGPTDCSGSLLPCVRKGNGNGVITRNVQANATIRNGTIQGMGRFGISLLGDLHLIEYTHIRSNGCGGILVRTSADLAGSIVQYNAVQRNGGSSDGSCSPLGNPGATGGVGIIVLRGTVRRNVADVNLGGITNSVGTVSYNVVTRNLLEGMNLDSSSSYIGNVLNGNGLSQVTGGTNLGQNLCGNAVCPGANF